MSNTTIRDARYLGEVKFRHRNAQFNFCDVPMTWTNQDARRAAKSLVKKGHLVDCGQGWYKVAEKVTA